MRRQALPDALAHRPGAFTSGVRQHEGELVPPEAATTSVSRALPRMTAAASIKARLPHRWAVRVVDALEAVEIDEQERERSATA